MTNRYTYDALNRLTNLVAGTPSTLLASFVYRLAAAGNRTNLISTVNAATRTNQWQYDPLYRLTNEVIAGSAPTGTISYNYDAVGNRTNRTSTVAGITNQTPSYNTNDQLTADVYDANGNTRTNVGNAFFYDAENRLTNAVVGGTNITIIYDGDGNRVRKVIGTTTNLYLVDARNLSGYAQVLEEKTGATLMKVYCYGLDLITQRTVSGNVLNYYGYDGNGNTRYLTLTNATVSDTYFYDAFGTTLTNTGTTTNFYRYAGEQYDSHLGFYYQRARYLNANSGRFVSRDSFAGHQANPMSLHRYYYCADDPVNKIDPSGNEYTAAGALTVVSLSQSLGQINFGGVASTFAARGPLRTKKLTVRIVTEIRPPDAQSGVKTSHAITVNEFGVVGPDLRYTGFTDLVYAAPTGGSTFGYKLHSQLFPKAFSLNMNLKANAATLPSSFDIDYNLNINFDFRIKMGSLTGTHDKYPSYKVFINGKSIYDFNQTGTPAGLYGVGNIKTDVNFNF